MYEASRVKGRLLKKGASWDVFNVSQYPDRIFQFTSEFFNGWNSPFVTCVAWKSSRDVRRTCVSWRGFSVCGCRELCPPVPDGRSGKFRGSKVTNRLSSFRFLGHWIGEMLGRVKRINSLAMVSFQLVCSSTTYLLRACACALFANVQSVNPFVRTYVRTNRKPDRAFYDFWASNIRWLAFLDCIKFVNLWIWRLLCVCVCVLPVVRMCAKNLVEVNFCCTRIFITRCRGFFYKIWNVNQVAYDAFRGVDIPTEKFTILELYDQAISVSELNRIRSSKVVECLTQ